MQHQMRSWQGITFAPAVREGMWWVPRQRGAGHVGRRSMPVPGSYTGAGGAGGYARPRVGGSVVRGMVISTVGLLIIGIICSPGFSPAN